MTRYEALQRILDRFTENDLALFTTGMISREAFNIRDRAENFYMLGSMGLLSSLGLGLALQQLARTIWVIEGDGSALMSLGAFPLIATCRPSNFIHIVLDNEAYESTGGQPSIASTVDLAALAESAGYPSVWGVTDTTALDSALGRAAAAKTLRVHSGESSRAGSGGARSGLAHASRVEAAVRANAHRVGKSRACASTSSAVARFEGLTSSTSSMVVTGVKINTPTQPNTGSPIAKAIVRLNSTKR